MKDLQDMFIDLRDLALTSEERSAMRSVLAAVSTPAARPVPSPFLLYFMRPAPLFALALIALLFAGGGTAALADGALPGDTLYAVKVHVNENIEHALAFTPEAKADVDIRHAEERLSEIELLAAKGDTDPAVITAAAVSVRAKIADATSTADLLASGGDPGAADDIRSSISSALLAHADILDAQAENLSDGPQQDLRALSVAAAVTADDADTAADASSSEETPLVNAGIALDREEGARASIDALTKALAENDSAVPQETHDELLLALAHIESDFSAQEDSNSDDYAEVADSYQALERRAYRALAALSAATRIADVTGKQVIVTIDSNGSQDDSEDTAASGPTLMKAATFAAPSFTPATSTERTHRHERALQFIIRNANGN